MGSNHLAILKTLLYSDIFDFPLKSEEIYRFLIAREKVAQNTITRALATLSHIAKKDGYYFLSGREHLVGLRLEREQESRRKLALTQKIIPILTLIPSILFIGVSGGVACLNAKRDDDIDLFIIAKKKTLWITRLLVLFLLAVLGKRRKKGEKHVVNKLCVNMLIDETSLVFPKERQNLYTAHEIMQLRQVFDRQGTYKRFVRSNTWTEKFLPNSSLHRPKDDQPLAEDRMKLWTSLLMLFEPIARMIQLQHIKKHMTKETVSDNFLAFHPFAYDSFVMKEFELRKKKYAIS